MLYLLPELLVPPSRHANTSRSIEPVALYLLRDELRDSLLEKSHILSIGVFIDDLSLDSSYLIGEELVPRTLREEWLEPLGVKYVPASGGEGLVCVHIHIYIISRDHCVYILQGTYAVQRWINEIYWQTFGCYLHCSESIVFWRQAVCGRICTHRQ